MASKKGAFGPGPGSSAISAGHPGWTRKNHAPVIILQVPSVIGPSDDDILRRTISFSHKRSLGKCAETKFVIRNDELELCDDPRFFPNQQWKYRFGYFNDMSPVIIGIIREIAPVYGEKKLVTVTLYDSLITASTKSSAKNWGRVTSTTIAKSIAIKHGWKYATEDSADAPKKAWIQPSDINDLRYLRDLAAQIDFEVMMVGDPPVLIYRKKKYDVAPKAVLTYYSDPTEFSYVKSFSPKVKSLGPVQAGVSGMKKAQSDDPTKNSPALKDQITFGDHSISTAIVSADSAKKNDVSVHAPKDVNTQSLADVHRQQMLDKAHEAHSQHPLTPKLTAGSTFEWAGIEKQLSGRWYVFSEEHSITGSGSETTVHWKRNATASVLAATKAAVKNNKPPILLEQTTFAPLPVQTLASDPYADKGASIDPATQQHTSQIISVTR